MDGFAIVSTLRKRTSSESKGREGTILYLGHWFHRFCRDVSGDTLGLKRLLGASCLLIPTIDVKKDTNVVLVDLGR